MYHTYLPKEVFGKRISFGKRMGSGKRADARTCEVSIWVCMYLPHNEKTLDCICELQARFCCFVFAVLTLLPSSTRSFFVFFVLPLCSRLCQVVYCCSLQVFTSLRWFSFPLYSFVKKAMVQIHPTSPNIIQTSSELWRSGSACDSSIRDIHKVIRSNRVSFIVPANHESSFNLFFPSSRASWASESHRERWAAGALSFCSL